MTDDLRNKVRHALDVAARLEAATDRLNQQLARMEGELRKLGLGVSAGVVLPTVGDDVFLRWDKSESTWLLTIVRPGGITPLLKAGRSARIAAASAMPALLDALIGEVVSLNASAETALASLEEALADVVRP